MEQEAPFGRVGIVGLGLIGGSIALAARRAWPRATVTGFDQTSATREAARPHTPTVDRLTDLDGSDLVVLAVPLAAMPASMAAVADFARPCVVTDVGSTKRDVIAAARAAGLIGFVGGHPMAGSERGGLDQARPDLFAGRPWLLVADDREADAARRIERFVSGLGAVPRWTDPDTHDRTVAYLSHLPQVVAVALMNAAGGALDNGEFAAGGRAFDEMTRLASSPPDLWDAILSQNADFVAEALRRFVASLPAEGDLEDGTWVREHFQRAAAARARAGEGRRPPP
jgi:prephenate dehydrogenase